MDKQYPQRKNMRHPNFNYSYPGACFITICTKNKEKLLAEAMKIKNKTITLINSLKQYFQKWDKGHIIRLFFKNICYYGWFYILFILFYFCLSLKLF